MEDARAAAAEAQREAREGLLARGIKITPSSPSDAAEARILMGRQKDEILRRLGIPTEFYSRFVRAMAEK